MIICYSRGPPRRRGCGMKSNILSELKDPPAIASDEEIGIKIDGRCTLERYSSDRVDRI